ncbi:MAG TPA: V-type ATPase subunit [Spirochaetia bacterium]|nr:V-type ATPase subunit [Spirochaetia bacterium]
MSRTSRYAFLHAKVCGVMAHSWAGESYRDLLRLKSLADLSERLFPGAHASSAPAPLPVEVESRIVQASVDAMVRVLDYLDDPPDLLVHVARRIEYRSVKTLARAAAHGTRDDSRIWNLAGWSGFRRPDPRNAEKTLAASEYAWVLKSVGNSTDAEVESKVDQHYYERLFDLARGLPAADRMPVLRLARAETGLENAVRVLRLRFFFHMDAEASAGLLIPGSSAAVRDALRDAFTLPADSADEWRRWRYAPLLEDQLGETFQSPDPLRAEQASSRLLYVRAHQAFHQHPFTLGPLVAYFRLKEHEASILSIAAEALHLGIPEAEAASLAGIR